jgi:hypothetical protein
MFLRQESNLAGRISEDKKHVVQYLNSINILGIIRNGKLYDNGLNYIGYFSNGALRDVGGNIHGYYHGDKYKDLEKKEDVQYEIKEASAFDFWLNLALYGIIVVGAIILGKQFMIIFFS